MVGRPYRKSESGREALPEVRKWLRDPVGGPEVVETLPEVWNWSKVSPGGPELFGRYSRWSETGRRLFRRCGTGLENIPEVWKWSGDPPGVPEVVGYPPGGVEMVGRHSWWYESGRETLQEV